MREPKKRTFAFVEAKAIAAKNQGGPIMVPPTDLLGYVRATPFRPFQIQMTGGRTFDIRHPEMIRVGRNSLIIFSFVSDDPALYDRWDTASLMLIESVSHQDLPASQGAAGSNNE